MNPTTKSPRGAWALLASTVLLATVLAGCGGQPPPECELLTRDGYEITVTKVDGTQETRQVYPSDEGLDADGDEVDDCVEFLNNTDPNDADTSGNGLLDGRNVTLAAGDPRAEQWVDRGIVHQEDEDGDLVFVGTADHGLNPTRQDHAGDGIMDGEEIAGFEVWILGEPRRVTTNPSVADTSGDGIRDDIKRAKGLDPSSRDTNGDGVRDTEDVNPWVDFQVRLEVVSLNLSSDPFGRRGDIPLTLHLGMPEVQITSSATAQVGETTAGDPWSSDILNPTDRGGNYFRGDHNVTFDLTAITQDGQEQRRVDLFSHAAGQEYLPGAIDALSGDLYHDVSQEGDWPQTATFEGEHGDITLRIVPVWPDVWQACVDDGCRHGDGEFEWSSSS